MFKSFMEYFRSYKDEVMIPYWNWIGKHRIGYYIVAPIIVIGVTFLYLLYLARKDNKTLKSNDYEEES